MSISVRISKGKNISIQGSAQNILKHASSDLYSLNPIDFHLLNPKLCVRVGDKVLAGSPLFFDKENTTINYCSPVSGVVKEIVRGEKRKILRVIIKADKKNKYKKFNVSNYQNRNIQEIKELMMQSGLWSLIQKRPFSIVANPNDQPKSIFVSCAQFGVCAWSLGWKAKSFCLASLKKESTHQARCPIVIRALISTTPLRASP